MLIILIKIGLETLGVGPTYFFFFNQKQQCIKLS